MTADLEQYQVPEPLRDRQSQVIVAALNEAGYAAQTLKQPDGRHMIRHNGPTAAFLKARNLAQRLNGLPEFPNLETYLAYRSWVRR